MTSSRRAARERALALLYEAELRGIEVAEVLAGLPVAPDPYAVVLVEGVAEHAEQIDELISRFARGWALPRMPAVDRAVLRMSVFELMGVAEVPTGVVISEGVALASSYSTDESGRFVNGLLGTIAREVRGGGTDAAIAATEPGPDAAEPVPEPDEG